jgi:hypothetical protein
MTQGAAAIITNGAKMRGLTIDGIVTEMWSCKSILTSLKVLFSRANEEGQAEKCVTAQIPSGQSKNSNGLS